MSTASGCNTPTKCSRCHLEANVPNADAAVRDAAACTLCKDCASFDLKEELLIMEIEADLTTTETLDELDDSDDMPLMPANVRKDQNQTEQKQKMEQLKAGQLQVEQSKAGQLQALDTKALTVQLVKTEQLTEEELMDELVKVEELMEELVKEEEEELLVEQPKLEQLKLEQTKAERTKLEQTKLEQTKLEQTKLEQTQQEQTQQEQTKLEQTTAEQTKAVQSKVVQLRTVQLKVGQPRAGQLKAGQLRAEQLKAEQLTTEQLTADQLKEEQLKEDQLKEEQLKIEQQMDEQQVDEQLKEEQAALPAQPKLKQLKAEQLKKEELKTEHSKAQLKLRPAMIRRNSKLPIIRVEATIDNEVKTTASASKVRNNSMDAPNGTFKAIHASHAAHPQTTQQAQAQRGGKITRSCLNGARSPTIIKRLRKSTRSTRFKSKLTGGRSVAGTANGHLAAGLGIGPGGGAGTGAAAAKAGGKAGAGGGTGAASGARNRRTLFKRAAQKTPRVQACTRFVQSVFFKGSYMQIGDIVSIVDIEQNVYYAQIRGLLVDAYCEKSAFLTWLIPTQDSPSPKEGFDPATYLIGPDEELSRKLVYLDFVMHAPSNYYYDRTTPFPMPDVDEYTPQRTGGFIWTRLPTIKRERERERKTVA